MTLWGSASAQTDVARPEYAGHAEGLAGCGGALCDDGVAHHAAHPDAGRAGGEVIMDDARRIIRADVAAGEIDDHADAVVNAQYLVPPHHPRFVIGPRCISGDGLIGERARRWLRHGA
jgi:hypothetical protein